MSKQNKGSRFTPFNYPIEVEQRIQELRKDKHVLLPPRKILRTKEQIAGIRASAEINTALLDFITPHVKAGVSTRYLDNLIYQFTTDNGAIPAPLGYGEFPKSACISINDVVCHGIPNEYDILEEGDIVNIDVSTIYKGYFSDASRMFTIGKVDPEVKRLVDVCKECLDLGIKAAQPWATLGDVGAAIQEHAEKNGFSVVRDFCGHGVGVQFHEDPEVLHYGVKGTGMTLVPGMTLTIEPMLNMGSYEVFIDSEDNWTACTDDGKPSAQWEHMLLITETGNEILTY
ncbi:methionine aminopeptidase, type I [Bacteroides coprosuis DSM 18011]|uniref:Methionine aminopeptidase n=1 Tax=Bacteroides coprosuis DSM 18011 TaxID=679937 RepID=F3ZPT6_9BACE|nr:MULTISPECIES: type I methionyl aminopeptidase [Bacteroides]EGJ71673.1 methionine aminopeptidase, type I [Bacteroides coprosuis DSM 18011]HJD92499.1 type I methionyl aminopeptidase [Bacteroides coprosuis]